MKTKTKKKVVELPTIEEYAKHLKRAYDAFLAAGFSTNEAFQLVLLLVKKDE